MNANNRRLERLEQVFDERPPPGWAEAVRDVERDGWRPEDFRFFLNILYETCPDYQQPADWLGPYRRFLAAAFREPWPELSPKAQAALHEEMRRYGLGHLVGDPAANNANGAGT
jgi:hypothetical protein